MYVFFINLFVKFLKNFTINFEKFERTIPFSLKMFIGGISYYILNFIDILIIVFIFSHYVTIYVLTYKNKVASFKIYYSLSYPAALLINLFMKKTLVGF